LLPLLSVISAALFVAFVFAMLSLLSQGHVLGFAPWAGVPLWVALLLVLAAYMVIGGPVGAARSLSHRYANGGRGFGAVSSADGLLWVLLVVLFFYAAWHYAPGLGDWLQALPWWHGRTAAWFSA
jgi:hypothetical protein